MDKKTLFTAAWKLAREAATAAGTTARAQFGKALKAAWVAAKAAVAEVAAFVPPCIHGMIRGGGFGADAWVARVTGTDPRYHLARRFLPKDVEEVSRSRRSGRFAWVLRQPGYYEFRNVQYEAGEATIGKLDRGYIRVDAAGEVTRVSKDSVIVAMQALEAAAAPMAAAA